MSVLVMIPSRDRPKEIQEAVLSVLETSQASICVYVDEDQHALYQKSLDPFWRDRRFHQLTGERVGPVASANEIARRWDSFTAYGLITDDSAMAVSGWDDYLLDEVRGGALVVSPSTTQGDHVDMPFVSAEWINKLGWFAYPGNYHTGWPTICGSLAEAIGRLVRAPRDKFFVSHDMLPSQNEERLREDARQLYAFFQNRFSKALEVLR